MSEAGEQPVDGRTVVVTDELIRRAASLDVCCVSDALDALGMVGAVPHLFPVWDGARVAGRAVTMRLAEGVAPSDRPAIHLGARAIDASGPDSVIVVDNGGRTAMGAWGGLLSLAASLRGVAGVVIDGACRDVDEARELRFAAFARSGVARTARGRVHEQSSGEPITLVGVPIETGDLIVADGSGVVVVAASAADAVIAKAEQIAARERRMQEMLRDGQSASQVLGGTYETMLRDV